MKTLRDFLNESTIKRLPKIDVEVDKILQTKIKGTKLELDETGVNSSSFDVTLKNYGANEKNNIKTLVSMLEKKYNAHYSKEQSSFRGDSAYLMFVFNKGI